MKKAIVALSAAVALLVTGYSSATSTIKMSISSSTKIKGDWAGLTFSFLVKQKGSKCSTHCSSNLGGIACSTLQLYAVVYNDYNKFWNNSIGCSIKSNKIDWPYYKTLKAAGGSKTYTFKEGDSSRANKTKKALKGGSPLIKMRKQ